MSSSSSPPLAAPPELTVSVLEESDRNEWRKVAVPWQHARCAEEAVHHLCRTALNVRPVAAALFGLRASNNGRRQSSSTNPPWLWLSPDQAMDKLDREAFPSVELRIRFKLPTPIKLHELDRQAFSYYYKQVRHDFVKGHLIANAIQPKISSTRWLHPIPMADGDAETDKNRIEFLGKVTRLASCNMTVDILDHGKNKKEVLSNTNQVYFPKGAYISLDEKLIGKLFGARFAASHKVNEYLERKVTSTDLKKMFLVDAEATFHSYFDEVFNARLQTGGATDGQEVNIIIQPPFLFRTDDPECPTKELEPLVSIRDATRKSKVTKSNQQGPMDAQQTAEVICTLEDICNISVVENDHNTGEQCRVELARRNGIPVRLSVDSMLECKSMVSHLAGYYRLCEKWSFSLCSLVHFPVTLDFCMANNVHGPVTLEFVEEKFRQKSRQKPGTYLLRQNCDKYGQFFLHYLPPSDSPPESVPSSSSSSAAPLTVRPEVLHVTRVLNPTRYVLTGGGPSGTTTTPSIPYGTHFDSLLDLARALSTSSKLTGEGNSISAASSPLLSSCLHPSENDKANTLLLCRSDSKQRSDFLGSDISRKESQKPAIPIGQLSRFENEQFSGRFTNVWRGSWLVDGKSRVSVAIKQLKKEHERTKLWDLNQLCTEALSWEDGTLVRSLGVCLATMSSPMALIQEYFHLGPLDVFLRSNDRQLEDVDLVEACAGLARAVWYLEDRHSMGGVKGHGRVRCGNVFVAGRSQVGGTFQVKLGDTGLGEPYTEDQVHWLPYELLLYYQEQKQPLPHNCTVKGDVWALATTYWEIFSSGAAPGWDGGNLNLGHFRQAYLSGERLERPSRLNGQLLPMYHVMQECWHPIPELRKEPQAVMRDVNLLLYRVFNSKKVHLYTTIDDGGSRDDDEVVSENSSSSTLKDTVGPLAPLEVEVPFLTSTPVPSFVGDMPPLPPFPGAAMTSPARRPSTAPPYSGRVSHLVPTYNTMMAKYHEALGKMNLDLLKNFGRMALDGNRSDSWDPLLASRPGSSLDQSSLMAGASQLTSQTSLASFSTLYSMNSIYQLNSESQLELRPSPLGEGNFGVVYLGVMNKSEGEWEQVAVKMLKDGGGGEEAAEEMQRELDIMKSLNHENVVKIKGVLQDHASRVIIIMEYVREGSLDRYLDLNRESIKFPKQLFVFALNIVEGMEYLARKRIIHRDLAARNILVASDECVKISDFGLARSTAAESGHYVMASNANIPVKWLAIECLTHNLYSTASDVWGFGVTLWEMFSFGACPDLVGCEGFFRAGASYEQHHKEMQLWVRYIEEGTRLPCPEGCPATVYSEVMKPCWLKDSRNRPSFTDLKTAITKAELKVT